MKPLENVSPDAQVRLEQYHDLLLKWQAKINLVSPTTIPDAWERHFVDSVQLVQYLPASGQIMYDLGSGGGFPGLIMAILRPELEVHLVESDGKKCAFLQTVSRETKTKVFIHNERIEKVVAATEAAPAIVSARALASLDQLLNYCKPWIKSRPDMTFLFPKGEQNQQEITVSREKWDFDLTEAVSKTDPKARILTLSHVRIRT